MAESVLLHSRKDLGCDLIHGDVTVVEEEGFDWVEVSWYDGEKPSQPNRLSTAEAWPNYKRVQLQWWRMSQLMVLDDWEIAQEVSTVKPAGQWGPEVESALNVGCNIRRMAW